MGDAIAERIRKEEKLLRGVGKDVLNLSDDLKNIGNALASADQQRRGRSEPTGVDDEDFIGEPDVKRAKTFKLYSIKGEMRYAIIKQNHFIVEKLIVPEKFERKQFLNALEHIKLLKALSTFNVYHPNLVFEFYANMMRKVNDEASGWYRKVYVRGQFVELSPSALNNMLKWREPGFDSIYPRDHKVDFNKIARTLTGYKLDKWPTDWTSLPSLSLSLKYFLLYKLATTNLLPTTNTTIVTKRMATLLYKLGTKQPVNLGQLIFQTTVDYAKSDLNGYVLYPCLISKLLQQARVEQLPEKEPVKEAETLKYQKKFEKQGKVDDLGKEPSAELEAITGESGRKIQAIINNLLAIGKGLDKQIAGLQEQRKQVELEVKNLRTTLRQTVETNEAGPSKN